MGTITIFVDDDVETSFRRIAGKMYSQKKGYLGDAITEAMKKWLDEQGQQRIAREELSRLRKGWNLGKILYKTRDELHER